MTERQAMPKNPHADSNPWVSNMLLRPKARVRLFCVPYAGSGASIFHSWPYELPSEIEVCPIQLPGRETRFSEPCYTQLIYLIQSLANALQPYLDRPFALFGHSMGALISFELARQLRRQHSQCPACLFASGWAAPQLPRTRPLRHLLSEAEFRQNLRDLQGTPEAVLQNSELMDLMSPVLRADFALCETYVYVNEEPLDCQIFAFGGLEDPTTSWDDLVGWHNQTTGVFRLEMLPGDHFFVKAQRMRLLRAISHALSDLDAARICGSW